VALVVLVAASAYLVVDKSAESHGALPIRRVWLWIAALRGVR
jgi:hypothetical protein